MTDTTIQAWWGDIYRSTLSTQPFGVQSIRKRARATLYGRS